MTLSSVDLPAPERPVTARNSPGRTRRSMPRARGAMPCRSGSRGSRPRPRPAMGQLAAPRAAIGSAIGRCGARGGLRVGRRGACSARLGVRRRLARRWAWSMAAVVASRAVAVQWRRARSGQISMWSAARRSVTRASRPSASTWAAWQLQPPGLVEDRELLGCATAVGPCSVAAGRGRGASIAVPDRLAGVDGLRARPAVPDGDRALDVVAHERVVGDDDDRRPAARRSPGRRAVRSCAAVSPSSSPVGSSASRTGGWLASAMATATRCCSPPDSSPGWPCRRAVGTPTRSMSRDRPLATLAGIDAVEEHGQLDVLGRPRDDRAGCARSAARRSRRPGGGSVVLARPSMRVRSCPATTARPAEGTSRPPRMFMSVDLPLPDAPTSAIISAGSTCRSRPWRATTSRSATL